MSSDLSDSIAAHRRWLESEGADGEPLDLARRSLRGADFRGLELTEADLSGADLSGARFGGTRLEGADLSSANLRGADMAGAWLASAELRGADLRDADLTGCDLTGVLLTETDLRSARLDGAVLDEALVDTSVVSPGLLRAVASSEDLTIGSVLLVVNGATVLIAPPGAANVLLHRRRDDTPAETGVHPLLVAVAADRTEGPPPWMSDERPLTTDLLASGSATDGVEQVAIDPSNHTLGWLAHPDAAYLVGVVSVDEHADDGDEVRVTIPALGLSGLFDRGSGQVHADIGDGVLGALTPWLDPAPAEI